MSQTSSNELTLRPTKIVREYLGRPLHTRAKSCDREIVRAQKKASKGRRNSPPKSCGVVMDPRV
jgi:hypothetical protein